MPHHRGVGRWAGSVGQRLAPFLAKALRFSGARTAVRYASIYLDALQGKGAAGKWNFDAEIDIVRRHVTRAAPVLFDVGVHRGLWSQRVLALYGDACTLYQFEPDRANVARLKKQPAPPNVHLIEKAVSDESGEVTFYRASRASDVSSMYERRESIFGDENFVGETVQRTTIDEVVEAEGIAYIDFMKMDIEGHELSALEGGRKTLEAGKVGALTFEFGSSNINSRTFVHDYWDFLTPLGYTLHRVGPGGVLLPIERYYEDLEHFRGATNYLALLKGRR